MTDNLQNGNEEILNNISKLQQYEKELYANLEDVSLSNEEKQKIIQQINNISDMRIKMYSSLNSIYSSYQQNAYSTNKALGQTIVATDVIENELNQAKKRMNLLDEQKNNKLRLVEINTYYGKRFNTYTTMMKTIVIICIPIIILTILSNYGILPTNIYYFFNGIILVIGTVVIGLQIIDIFNRDNMNWDEYDWYFDRKNAPSINDTTDNLDSNAMDPWTTPSLTCVGSACCYEGSTYDNDKNICVPNDKLNEWGVSRSDKLKESFEQLGRYGYSQIKMSPLNNQFEAIQAPIHLFKF